MKRYFLISMLFVLCGLSAFADNVTGETPVAGSSYYIYNIGQQKYLTVSGTTVSLGTSGTQFTVAAGTTSGTYTLTASAKLSSTFLGDIVCSDDGYYTDWKFSLLSSTDKTYALGILENEDAYSFSYMYYSDVLSGIAKTSTMPDYEDGAWVFTTSTAPSEITYSVGSVEIPTVKYNATSATINYTIISSTGDNINCSHDVTFDANESSSDIETKGTFTDDTYNLTINWTVKQSAKPELVTKVTLYQNSTEFTIPENMAETVDVYLYRSPMAANKKSSFSVPFRMTYKQLVAAFGSNFTLYNYRTYNSENNKLYYAEAVSINAGVPYIVIPDATAAETEEETAAREANTELDDTDARLYIIKGVPSSSFTSNANTVTHGEYMYCSNFVCQTVSAGFFTFDETTDPGVLKLAGTDREVKGFRAYFKATDSSAKALTNVVFDDEWATSIDEIDAEEPLTIYNVNGQLVRKDAKNTDGLSKGVYIVNGKKVMVK